MTIYIAGKITGDKYYKCKFWDAEKVLADMGYTVFNPSMFPEGLSWDDYMAIDEKIIDAVDMVCFLPDWRESKGALHEMGYAIAKKKAIAFLSDGALAFMHVLSGEFSVG